MYHVMTVVMTSQCVNGSCCVISCPSHVLSVFYSCSTDADWVMASKTKSATILKKRKKEAEELKMSNIKRRKFSSTLSGSKQSSSRTVDIDKNRLQYVMNNVPPDIVVDRLKGAISKGSDEVLSVLTHVFDKKTFPPPSTPVSYTHLTLPTIYSV